MNIPKILTALSPAEAEALQAVARGRRVLEIGSQFGFSTVVMAEVAQLVVSIDWHRGDGNVGFMNSLTTFRENLERYGVGDRVIPIVARSQDSLPLLRPGFHLLFHDGNHDYQTVRDDLTAAWPLITEYILLHDYGRFDGLTRACHEVLGQPRQVVDSLAIYNVRREPLQGIDVLANS